MIFFTPPTTFFLRTRIKRWNVADGNAWRRFISSEIPVEKKNLFEHVFVDIHEGLRMAVRSKMSWGWALLTAKQAVGLSWQINNEKKEKQCDWFAPPMRISLSQPHSLDICQIFIINSSFKRWEQELTEYPTKISCLLNKTSWGWAVPSSVQA